MKSPRSIMTALVLGECLIGVSAIAATEEIGRSDYSRDITRLQDWVLLDRSFPREKIRPTLSALERMLAADTAQLSRAEFYMTVRSMTALADNGHSNASLSPVYSEFGLAALHAYWFSDGLFVVGAPEPWAALVGARIVAIEGLAMEELLDRLDEWTGGTRTLLRAHFALPLMFSQELMQAAGIVEDGALTISFITQDNEAISVDFGPEDMATDLEYLWPWQHLVPDIEDGAHDWVSLKTGSNTLPFWLKDPGKTFRSEWLSDETLYIQFRENSSTAHDDIDDFMAGVEAQLKANPARTIILDNRNNPGGDLTATAEFVFKLPGLLKENGQIAVLTGNETFSAGIYNSFFAKAALPDRTLVLGADVGDRPVFWAERWKPFFLPETGWSLGYALEHHNLVEGCQDAHRCHLAGNGLWNIAVGTITPDRYIPMTFTDYKKGRDPVLEAALEMARN